MSPALYSEDTLVQQTTAEYLEERLGWTSVFAHNSETFGPDGTLGRTSEDEVVLTRYLRLPGEAYGNAVRAIVEVSAAQSTLQTNQEKYDLLRNGVKVTYRDPRGGMETRTLRVFDFDHPENNHFLAVRELWIKGPLYRRRADLVGFVNGVPLLFMELKNIHRNVRRAYDENLADYKDTIPHLFYHNAFVVLGNGVDARIGSYSAPFEYFREWKRLDEDEPGVVDMETLLKGVCTKANFLDLLENYVLFDDSGERLVKVVAQNQQYLGVTRAVRAVEERQTAGGRLGVFWHTQGAGKSYSMVFFSRKVHRKLGGNFTFLVLCDRDDLDNQIYRTYAGCGVVGEQEEVRAGSGRHLKRLLGQHKAYVFSLIQKFNQDVEPDEPYSERGDIIVIVDEAHRTQYGRLALNQRNALPNALYIAFTGTPLMKEDELTRRVFGDYVSRYGFQRAVEDGATVPLYYDARGEKLGVATDDLNERIAEKLDEFEAEDVDVEQRLERELKRDYHIITAPERLDAIARDFVAHYTTAWDSGKAIIIVIDKITAVRMHGLIEKHWSGHVGRLEGELSIAANGEARLALEDRLAWMKKTKIAVVVSEEQGEVGKFRNRGLDTQPHRRLIKEGFESTDGERVDVERLQEGRPPVPGRHRLRDVAHRVRRQEPRHPLPRQAAQGAHPDAGHRKGEPRARRQEQRPHCRLLRHPEEPPARACDLRWPHGSGRRGREDPPAKPHEELLDELAEAIDSVREFLATKAFRLEEIIEKDGFERNAAIAAAKEVVNENDETRKRFEIMARIVFRKFRASLTLKEVHVFRSAYDAIDIVYKSLQAVDLYARLRDQLTRIRDWDQKQATRDQVKLTIRDFLYSDKTGLPESYSEDEVTKKSELVFGHYLTRQQQGFPLAGFPLAGFPLAAG